MSLALRRSSDPAPEVSARVTVEVRPELDPVSMAALQNRTVAEMEDRMTAGHRAWIAWRDGAPAAFGWTATRTATIGELGLEFEIASHERYLWNFVTLPAHRGLGIYPQLLDCIVRADTTATRFWIAYAPENGASAAGIRRAGFSVVADLSFDDAGRPAVRGRIPSAGVEAASFLGLPQTEETLAPCWRCVRAGRQQDAACRNGYCCCDYQQSAVLCNDGG